MVPRVASPAIFPVVIEEEELSSLLVVAIAVYPPA
jgi:hypothetical protein